MATVVNKKYVSDAINTIKPGAVASTSSTETANVAYVLKMIDVANGGSTNYGDSGSTQLADTALVQGALSLVITDQYKEARTYPLVSNTIVMSGSNTIYYYVNPTTHAVTTSTNENNVVAAINEGQHYLKIYIDQGSLTVNIAVAYFNLLYTNELGIVFVDLFNAFTESAGYYASVAGTLKKKVNISGASTAICTTHSLSGTSSQTNTTSSYSVSQTTFKIQTTATLTNAQAYYCWALLNEYKTTYNAFVSYNSTTSLAAGISRYYSLAASGYPTDTATSPTSRLYEPEQYYYSLVGNTATQTISCDTITIPGIGTIYKGLYKYIDCTTQTGSTARAYAYANPIVPLKLLTRFVNMFTATGRITNRSVQQGTPPNESLNNAQWRQHYTYYLSTI